MTAFTEASAAGADRTRQLAIAAQRLAAGLPVDPDWLRVQLLDLRDLLRKDQ